MTLRQTGSLATFPPVLVHCRDYVSLIYIAVAAIKPALDVPVLSLEEYHEYLINDKTRIRYLGIFHSRQAIYYVAGQVNF